MSEEHCGNCKFWSTTSETTAAGICRRYPPTYQTSTREEWGSTIESDYSAWPEVERYDWCGEYKERGKK